MVFIFLSFLFLFSLLEPAIVLAQFTLRPFAPPNPPDWSYDSGIDGDHGIRDMRIRCIGDFPPFLPLDAFPRQQPSSLLDICGRSDPRYVRESSPDEDEAGPSTRQPIPFPGLGGYCSWFAPNPTVWFDTPHLLGSHHSPWNVEDDLITQRVLQYCHTKCSCLTDAAYDSQREVKLVVNREEYLHLLSFTEHDLDSFDVEPRHPHGSSSVALQFPLELVHLWAGAVQTTSRRFVTSRSHFITCSDNMPPPAFMPPEFFDSFYLNLQSLCAAPIVSQTNFASPGTPGGICAPMPSQTGPNGVPAGPYIPTVIFPDELAHPAFNHLAGEHGLLTALWCHQHCWCATGLNQDPSLPPRPETKVRWLHDATVDFSGGGVRLSADIMKADGTTSAETLTLVEPDSSEGPSTSRCGKGGACPEIKTLPPSWLPLPKMSLGAPQKTAVGFTELIGKQPIAQSCGRFCSSNIDCGGIGAREMLAAADCGDYGFEVQETRGAGEKK
ncbi:MAG: hypothetical protein M1814_005782 [Vezdaea aestivalis]|nr:MAG: hypothetical protein M1814_005782 [Vezdaea aestivalis]